MVSINTCMTENDYQLHKVTQNRLLQRANTSMTLNEIREALEKNGAYNKAHNQIISDWLAYGCETKFELGLTIMPKKVLYKYVPKSRGVKNNQLLKHLNISELEEASIRFVKILNRLVYKHSYERYNKKLDVVMVIEGVKSKKDLHTHFAFTKPKEMMCNEFARRVKKALEMSGDFEIFDPTYNFFKDRAEEQYRYKLDIIDSDWLYYITKELEAKSVHNLYLP